MSLRSKTRSGDFAPTFGIPNVDSRIHITLHPIPLKLLVNNSSKRPAFVFPNVDFALMFDFSNADSVSTSHFPIPLKTISHNSTDGTKNTYPRLRAGGYLTYFKLTTKKTINRRRAQSTATTNCPDPVVAGVKAYKRFNFPTEAQRITPVPTTVAFCDTTKLVHFPPTADKRETLYIRTVFPAKAKSITIIFAHKRGTGHALS